MRISYKELKKHNFHPMCKPPFVRYVFDRKEDGNITYKEKPNYI